MNNTMYVTCHVCGAAKKELNGHLRMHSLSVDEYQSQFPNAPIISESARLAKSAGLKGKKRKSPNFSAEDRERRRQMMKDKWARLKEEMGEEAYLNLRAAGANKMRAAKGDNYTHSEVTKQKMRGERLHTRGVSKSLEHRAKLSAAAKTRPVREKHTPETIARMKEAWARRKQDKETYGAYVLQLRARQNMPEAQIRARNATVKRLKDPKYYQKQFDTKIELQFKNFLESHHLAYEGQFVLQTAIGQFCFDFYIPGSNMLVEIDGEYWHSKSCEQINRDRLKLKLAHKAGYLCVRISDQDWRPEIIFQSPDSINLHNTQLITSRLEKLQKGSS